MIIAPKINGINSAIHYATSLETGELWPGACGNPVYDFSAP